VLKHYEKHRRQSHARFRQHAAHGDSTSVRRCRAGSTDAVSLVAALQLLPTDQQIALELRHGEDLKLEEVAEALDVSLATVKRYLSAAEEKMRSALGGPDSIANEYAKL
jgi:RNA polymerase sigma factor (sigma-70 family)